MIEGFHKAPLYVVFLLIHLVSLNQLFNFVYCISAGFPAAAYLAAGLQQPLYGYGAAGAVGAAGAAGATGAAAPAQPQLGGVSSQQLEDLAAMQRNSLANLPLVGTAAGSQAAAASSKGVRKKRFLACLQIYLLFCLLNYYLWCNYYWRLVCCSKL